jgi:hypothetical protein
MEEIVTTFAWRKGLLQWKLWPQQVPIYEGIRSLEGSVETVVILCARQFGKSYLGAIMAVEDALRHPNKCILIMGPTYKQAIEIVAPRIRDIARDAPPGLITRTKSEGKWFVGESEIVVGGFDQNSSSQRGKTVQNIYIEEIVDSNPDRYIESMRSDLGPALTHSDGGKMIFLTTLPKIPSHPFVVQTIPQARLNNAFYSYTIDDNLALNKQQYEACIRRSGGRDSVDFRREYLNELIRDEHTSICPPFDRTRHVRAVVRPGEGKYTTVVDWGGVRDKTVALVCVYDFERNKLLILAERAFGANTPTSQIVNELKPLESYYGVDDRVADCPGQLSIDLGRMNYRIRMPIKQDWVAGMNAMQVAFSLDQIEVDQSCTLLIETLESGQYNKQKTDFARSQALGHCDAAAALLYAWRSVPRENPYQLSYQANQNTFVVRSFDDPLNQVSNAIQPKAFGSFKRK